MENEILDSIDSMDIDCCTVCQKFISMTNGAYQVNEYWFCSEECELKLETRATIKFIYK
jgi:YHS domain-containing protein